MERFFDESGGMQLVIHSPFGNRVNRAWGLAAKTLLPFVQFRTASRSDRRCHRHFPRDATLIPARRSVPLFEFQNRARVLVQALLDAPMFTIRWRWNATRHWPSRVYVVAQIPAPLQRMESENLFAAVFPDQLACLEHIVGDREIPDHPLVNQTIDDCLTEAMDIDGLEEVLRKIENGKIHCLARDLPEPSPWLRKFSMPGRTHFWITRRWRNAAPRRFNAPRIERNGNDGLGILDTAAIDKVQKEASEENEAEMHDALMLLGVMTTEEIQRNARNGNAERLHINAHS